MDDPLEQRTWADIRIHCSGRTLTRLFDRYTGDERATLHVPAFPIARWLVMNWWALLGEPNRMEKIPPPGWTHNPDLRLWVNRHCMRSAEAGLMLPNAYIFGDSEDIYLQWIADDPYSSPRMPIFFVDSGIARIDRIDAEDSLREFISKVFARVADSEHPEVVALRDNWRAITAADPAELGFCRAAGRMGLDPYATDSWPPELLQLLESEIGDHSSIPLVGDFLDAANLGSVAQVWKWIKNVESTFNLTAGSPLALIPPLSRISAPAEAGYKQAQLIRAKAGIGEDVDQPDLRVIAKSMGITENRIENINHLSDRSIRAEIGWNNKIAVFAGPWPKRPDSSRFLEARALFHAAYSCSRGPRLITESHTWDQQAGRAFAAELLAPIASLHASIPPSVTAATDDLIKSLANDFAVSTRVIRLQLENSGISIENE